MNFPVPSRDTVVKVMGNGVIRAVGKGGVALLSGLEVPWINGAGEILQGFGSRVKGEPQAPGGWFWLGWRGVIVPYKGGRLHNWLQRLARCL